MAAISTTRIPARSTDLPATVAATAQDRLVVLVTNVAFCRVDFDLDEIRMTRWPRQWLSRLSTTTNTATTSSSPCCPGWQSCLRQRIQGRGSESRSRGAGWCAEG